MMKVYKVVSYHAVEELSFDGWELVQVIHATRKDLINLRTPVAVEGCAPTYSGGCPTPGHVDQSSREEVVLVNEPLFLMSQDREIIVREKKLAARIDELLASCKKHEESAKSAEQQFAQATRNTETYRKHADDWEDRYTKEFAARVKLEGDLAKVRAAVGTTAFNDALK